jgi:ribosomal protein L19E
VAIRLITFFLGSYCKETRRNHHAAGSAKMKVWQQMVRNLREKLHSSRSTLILILADARNFYKESKKEKICTSKRKLCIH